MPEEVIDGLAIKPDGVYVDCTLGGAGHSSRIAALLSERGRLIGIDQDEEAIAAAKERLAGFPCKIDIVHDNFRHLDDILGRVAAPVVDGVLYGGARLFVHAGRAARHAHGRDGLVFGL